MSKKERQRKINDFKRLFTTHKNTCGSHEGCVRFGLNETYEHAKKKFALGWEAKELDEPFYTELMINCGSDRWRKVDFCYPSMAEVIEIMNSETDKISENKTPLPKSIRETKLRMN